MPAQAMVQPSIVHGRDTAASEFGFIVAVGSPYRSSGKLYVQQDCAGTLVTPLKVITAAHCLWDDGAGTDRGADDLAVGSGLDLRTQQQVVEVASAVYHPDYDGSAGTYENDIAVLTLKTPILGTARLLPATPGSGSAQAGPDTGLTAPGATVTTAGWGSTGVDNTGEPNIATAADLAVFGIDTCDTAIDASDKKVATVIDGVTFYQYPEGEVNDSVMICAMGVNDSGQIVDACGGDSGGPLTGGTGASRRLVGVVSWGPDEDQVVAVGGSGVCATPLAGVYTRISAFSGSGGFLSQQGVPFTNPLGAPSRPALAMPARASSNSLSVSADAGASGTTAAWIRFTATPSPSGTASSCVATVNGSGKASCTISGLSLSKTHTVTAIAYDSAGDASSASVTRTLLASPTFGSGNWVGFSTKYKVPVIAAKANGVTKVSTLVTCRKGTKVAFTATVVNGNATLPFVTKGNYTCTATSTYTSGGQQLTTLPSGPLPFQIT